MPVALSSFSANNQALAAVLLRYPPHESPPKSWTIDFQVWDVATARVLAHFNSGEKISGNVALSPDGKLLAY